jgi:hypothetical protein
MRGFTPKGRTSANGSCRLLATRDRPVALNLPRADDLAVLDALIEAPVGADHWSSIEAWTATRTAGEVIERMKLLHLAAGELGEATTDAVVRTRVAPSREARPLSELTVIDLTSMWAGPLCALLLRCAGASVLKVEARARRDGARLDERFYSWLHPPGQAELILDLGTPAGREQLRDLLESADVVLESSRPRALRQLGLGVEQLSLQPGVVWAAITARGPAEPMAVGFGDDAAVAGGLVAMGAERTAMFCGDAIADPITGMFAAAEVLEAIEDGGGMHLGISMAGCAASMIDQDRQGEQLDLRPVRVRDQLRIDFEGASFEVAQPKIPGVL